MPDRRHLALTIALVLAAAPALATEVEHLGTYIWRESPDPDFGGFSAVEIGADGSGFHALTDRAHLYWGRIDRDDAGRIRAMVPIGKTNLRNHQGDPLPPGRRGDSEGMAIDDQGRIWISFEGIDRIAVYDHPEAPATPQPRPPKLRELRINSGFESLAIRDDGTLITMPERSLGPDQPFPVLYYRDGEWHQPYSLRRDQGWLPVASDFGPDGLFYLLERDFHGVLGFSSRVRRMALTDDGPSDEQILFETAPMRHDNLEGLSVWHDGQDIRLTMISDDNFNFLQRTEVVEYRLRD